MHNAREQAVVRDRHGTGESGRERSWRVDCCRFTANIGRYWLDNTKECTYVADVYIYGRQVTVVTTLFSLAPFSLILARIARNTLSSSVQTKHRFVKIDTSIWVCMMITQISSSPFYRTKYQRHQWCGTCFNSIFKFETHPSQFQKSRSTTQSILILTPNHHLKTSPKISNSRNIDYFPLFPLHLIPNTPSKTGAKSCPAQTHLHLSHLGFIVEVAEVADELLCAA